MPPQKAITVLNTPCVLTHRNELADRLAAICESPAGIPPLSVDFTNVHIVAMRAVRPEFFKATSSVDWFVSDSQVLNWAMSLLGAQNHSRIYGPDFMNHFFQRKETSISHYFLGASDACLETLKRKITEIQPGYRLAGSHNGYFGTSEEQEIAEDINRCQPDIVWVGLGTPKQQEWIDRNKNNLRCKAVPRRRIRLRCQRGHQSGRTCMARPPRPHVALPAPPRTQETMETIPHL